jgi:hypothetical protein
MTFSSSTVQAVEIQIMGRAFYNQSVLWCLTPLSTIFQLYHGAQFYWWWKPEYTEKTTDL